MKRLCSNTPVLAYADYTKPFVLHTDASGLGLGAVLYQKQEDETMRPVAYASRCLSKSESKYPAHKLEFLALKWSVTDRFHEYLYGGTFQVFTDNNPLTYILTTAKLDACGQRWVASLANYNFDITYKTGKTNIEADALSRIPWEQASIETLEDPVVKAIMSGATIDVPYLESYFCNPYQKQEEAKVIMKGIHIAEANQRTEIDWKKRQLEDPDIGPLYELVLHKKVHFKKGTKEDSDEFRGMLRNKSQFILRNELLFRKTKKSDTELGSLQFVLPKPYRNHALMCCHNDIGHLGIEKSLDLLRDRFYWVGMAQDMENHIKKCDRCLKFKTRQQCAKLEPIHVTHPMELVHMDFLTLEHGKNNSKDVNLLIVTDHFTRYSQAFVTRSQTASTVAQVLWDKFIIHYGLPKKLLSDQGQNFESKLIAEMCRLTGIKKLRTSPYRPQTNGQCERFNSTLISMIGTLPPEAKQSWQTHVSTLVHAYNCTKNAATNFSPYLLMYGRKPLLPIDLEFGIRTPDIACKTTYKYNERMKHRLNWAYRKAQETSEKESKKNKERYDRKARCTHLQKGDLVLVRQKSFKGKHKIQDRWENEPYEVISQLRPNLPVYKVMKKGSDSKPRVLHRNLLFPLLHKGDEITEVEDKMVENNDTFYSQDEESINSQEEEMEDSLEEFFDAEEDETPAEYSGPITRSMAKGLDKVVAKKSQCKIESLEDKNPQPNYDCQIL